MKLRAGDELGRKQQQFIPGGKHYSRICLEELSKT
jgi:hypothetical protein